MQPLDYSPAVFPTMISVHIAFFTIFFLYTKDVSVNKISSSFEKPYCSLSALDIVILFSASQWVDMEMELQTVLECRRGPKSYPLFPKSIVVLPYSLRQLILLHQAPNSAEIYRQYYTS